MKAPEELRRWAESLGFVLVPRHAWEAYLEAMRRRRKPASNAKWAKEMDMLKSSGMVKIDLDRFVTQTADAMRHRMQAAALLRGMTQIRVRVVGGMVYVFRVGINQTTKETK